MQKIVFFRLLLFVRRVSASANRLCNHATSLVEAITFHPSLDSHKMYKYEHATPLLIQLSAFVETELTRDHLSNMALLEWKAQEERNKSCFSNSKTNAVSRVSLANRGSANTSLLLARNGSFIFERAFLASSCLTNRLLLMFSQ